MIPKIIKILPVFILRAHYDKKDSGMTNPETLYSNKVDKSFSVLKLNQFVVLQMAGRMTLSHHHFSQLHAVYTQHPNSRKLLIDDIPKAPTRKELTQRKLELLFSEPPKTLPKGRLRTR